MSIVELPSPAVPSAGTPRWTGRVDNPYLAGPYAPVVHETTAVDLEVVGEVPGDLTGAVVRNGPNAVFEPRGPYHWFDGDGMVHAVWFREGRVSYRSRLIPTRGLAEELVAGRALFPGVMDRVDPERPIASMKDTANTDLVWHHGRLLALWYLCGEPHRLDPATLEPDGIDDFGGRRTTTVSAHPKHDPRTDELVWFTLGDVEPPYMTYGVCDPDGTLVHETPIDLPGPRAPHDITIADDVTILHDFPLYPDPVVLREHGHRVVRFHPDEPTRFGVVGRREDGVRVRWFEFEPGYVLHMVNAWRDGDWIVMDGCLQPDPTIRPDPAEGPLASMLAYLRIRAHLHRWRMNLRTGEAREEQLDDLNVEFCLPDTARYGQPTRWSYHQHLPVGSRTVDFAGIVKYDHTDGSSVRWDHPRGWMGSESPFAPRDGARAEDDGYVLSFMSHLDGRSELWVFDATDLAAGPVCRVALPSRVPAGFHATWLTADQVWGAGDGS